MTCPDWLPSILSVLTVELRWGKSGLNDLCWRRTMQRWKAQTERISKIYGCAGYGRKMDELWRMGSSRHQFHRCIGIQYWYSTYMSTGIYVYKYTSTGIQYQNGCGWVINYIKTRARWSSVRPRLLTSPSCDMNWGKVQGSTDNPAKTRCESAANHRDSAITNLGNHLQYITCSPPAARRVLLIHYPRSRAIL